MPTSERPPQSADVHHVDMSSWAEADFEEKCTYVVNDQPVGEETKKHGETRAERSLPRNLALKRCPESGEVCQHQLPLWSQSSLCLCFV